MLYGFELSHNIAEATKNICSVKSEVAVNHSSVIGWLKKFQESRWSGIVRQA